MDGAFQSLKVGGKYCVVEDAARKFKEEAQIRLANIAYGRDPEYINGISDAEVKRLKRQARK